LKESVVSGVFPNSPSVLVRPEPVGDLKSRLRAALGPVFDHEEVLLGTALRPGEIPAHVFDFECGVRLIVSRERTTGGRVFTHLSGSYGGSGGGLERVRKGVKEQGRSWLVAFFAEHWFELAGPGVLEFIGFSPRSCIAHFQVPGGLS
jgi:hypothetical protein